MDPQTTSNIAHWLKGNYDDDTKQAILNLIETNPKEACDAFYTTLTFGTGGLRGLMGIGTNRINEYTVRATTQGLANYIKKQPASPHGHAVFIGFDCRHHSHTFAKEAAKVLAANGLKVFLCKELRPTPLVSFGCRLKKCAAAIMITASHNPPEYNGYKVYGSDGGQVSFFHAQGILQEIEKINDPSMVNKTSNITHSLISVVHEEIDELYIKAGSRLQYYPEDNQQYGKDLKIVYTSLHGTGITLIPKMLAAWGFSTLSFVDKQIIPNGDFPTAKFPNPEEKSTLSMGIEKLLNTQSDLLIANDPDADRIGVAVLHEGKSIPLDGNQIACLCLAHICEALTTQSKMPAKAAFIKTLVTTELFQAICDSYHKPCFNVLPGFKYIAEKILEWETNPKGLEFIFGGEDSYGYLYGTLTRDKDAIIPAALISQMALQAKRKGKTLVDLLYGLYRQYGVFVESLVSVDFAESKEGKEKMKLSMDHLREHIPTEIHGIAVVTVEDFLSSIKTNMQSQITENISLPSSNMIRFCLADGSTLTIRPSGTEPKVKLYCGVTNSPSSCVEENLKRSKIKAAQLLDALKRLIILHK